MIKESLVYTVILLFLLISSIIFTSIGIELLLEIAIPNIIEKYQILLADPIKAILTFSILGIFLILTLGVGLVLAKMTKELYFVIGGDK